MVTMIELSVSVAAGYKYINADEIQIALFGPLCYYNWL